MENTKAKKQQALYSLVKQVAWHCHAYRVEKVGLKQWQDFLAYAIKESLAISEQTVKETEEQGKDRLMALCSWAKDVKTQDWVMMHPDVHIDRKSTWRWVNKETETPGMINALERFRGIPRITNGILVYCERGDGSVFKGHLDWFVKDEKERQAKEGRRSKKEEEFKKRMAEYV